MVLERNDCPVPTSSSDESSLDIDNQDNCIELWAKACGCWYDDPHGHYRSLGYRFYGFGGEAQIYAESDSFVHKICRIGQYSCLKAFYDRIVIQNTLCPIAALEVEGYGRDNEGNFVVLLKQMFFRQAHLMTEIEISLFMHCLGFKEVLKERYHNTIFLSDSVVVEDLHSGNIWMTAEGNVVIVDGYFAFNDYTNLSNENN